ncbi:DNA helicase RecQ [Rhizophagus irregularis DAOM 181602=DAOM 197198]|nr:DNA helicase RecQ [Rhizophagus irregularis DAOM 181602=DAOM 197198]
MKQVFTIFFIASDRNWKHLEQQIMKYYTRCVYATASDHEKCWPEVCWIVENPDLILPTPNLVDVNKDQCLRLVEFLKRITKLKDDQSLITTIRTSYNEAFNRLKLNYTEKKTDYPKSFKARHALSVIHNNNGFDLVPYGRQVYKEINKSKFIPSFANLVPSFKTSCLKCIGYQSFAKKYSSGLCNLCGFLLKNNLPSSLPKLRNQQASSSSSCRELAISSIVQFFGFERYRELQCESIESFLSEQNTLTILRTGRGKSLIYAAASILSQALTVVFTPQKSLMDNQVREMVKFGIPAAMLYVSSEQSPQVQEKIVSEIASGDSWHQLKCIKQDFPSVPLLALTATCSPEDAAKIETVLKRPNMKVIRSPIIHHNHEGRVIIFSATIQHCIDITDELRKAFDPSIVAMYHGKMSSSEQTATSNA